MKKYYVIFYLLLLIIIIYSIYFIYQYKIFNKCDINGCPIKYNQNELYKIYDDYKELRYNNSKLANSFIIKSGLNSFLSDKGPKNIFIIRHAEKNYHEELPLNCNGILRSTLIPELIEKINKNGIGINAIISPYDYKTMHEQQTITLTSWLLDIPLFMYGENYDTKIAVENVFNNPYFNGKSVLFCRKHTCIQQLIKDIINIGVKVKKLENYQFINPEGNNKLPYWNFYNYDSLFYFDNNLNFSVYKIGLNTCSQNENYSITYGKKQICEME